MSMISGDLRQSYRERNPPGTPDSRRMSANARTQHDSGDRTDPLTGESLPEDYRVFNFETKDERDKAFAAKLLAGRGKSPGSSLRGGGYTGSSYNINSSHTPANRKDRPRSLSDDRRESGDMFETVALLKNGDPLSSNGDTTNVDSS